MEAGANKKAGNIFGCGLGITGVLLEAWQFKIQVTRSNV
jgi:hypothetical protein